MSLKEYFLGIETARRIREKEKNLRNMLLEANEINEAISRKHVYEFFSEKRVKTVIAMELALAKYIPNTITVSSLAMAAIFSETSWLLGNIASEGFRILYDRKVLTYYRKNFEE